VACKENCWEIHLLKRFFSWMRGAAHDMRDIPKINIYMGWIISRGFGFTSYENKRVDPLRKVTKRKRREQARVGGPAERF